MVTLSDGVPGFSSKAPTRSVLKLHECACTVVHAYVIFRSLWPAENVGVDQKGLEMCFGWP